MKFEDLLIFFVVSVRTRGVFVFWAVSRTEDVTLFNRNEVLSVNLQLRHFDAYLKEFVAKCCSDFWTVLLF